MLFKLIEYLIENSHQLDKRILLNIILRFGIPFNSTHPFKIITLTNEDICLKQKLTWFNKNHLRGMHACAISTIGELTAGMLLMKSFSPSKNRFILKSLSTEYHYQGLTHLFSKAVYDKTKKQADQEVLAKDGKVEITINAEIFDKRDQHVATVVSVWQLKSWSRVGTN